MSKVDRLLIVDAQIRKLSVQLEAYRREKWELVEELRAAEHRTDPRLRRTLPGEDLGG